MEKHERSKANKKIKVSRKIIMLICVLIIVSALFIGSVFASQTAGTTIVEEWKAILERVLNSLNSINDPHA